MSNQINVNTELSLYAIASFFQTQKNEKFDYCFKIHKTV